ncbi:hypothetical protein OQA88_9176 [Cercophora sp. LCS_1]
MARPTLFQRCRERLDLHPKLKTLASGVIATMPPANFITIHYAYFILTCLVASAVFWASSTSFKVSYVDSLFLVVSAMTESGLNTVNLSQVTTWQQVMLWLLIIVGSTIWVSIVTVLARKRAFERHFDEIVQAERERTTRQRDASRTLGPLQRIMSSRKGSSRQAAKDSESDREDALGTNSQTEAPGPSTAPIPVHDGRSSHATTLLASGGHVAFSGALRPNSDATSAYRRGSLLSRRNMATFGPRPDSSDDNDDRSQWRRIIAKGTAGRSAMFHDLTAEERDRLGGYEYRALKMLSIVVPLYSLLWQFLGAVAVGGWIAYNSPDVATSNGIHPWWAGIFYAVSAFNNSGMSLIDLNMIPFQQAYFVLITMGLLILAGNTAYPLFLRLIFWTAWKGLQLVTDDNAYVDTKLTLEFILQYPRRVYTNLFPSRATWWLFFMVLLLNGIDWLLFEILNFGNPVIDAIPLGPRILDGLFQALAVRSGGFYVIPISAAYAGLQVMYVIMMYVSVYPVVITMRHSNVYEERSLGIYPNTKFTPDDPESTHPRVGSPSNDETLFGTALRQTLSFQGVGAQTIPAKTSRLEERLAFINQQVRSQLAHDLWWLALAVFAITTIETRHFLEDPLTFNVFNVIFEVVSAYGTVGISVGLPTQNFSFSGGWYDGSKLVLCLVMLRGRHRGLPVALDRAVRLPGEHLFLEEEDQEIRVSRLLWRQENGGPQSLSPHPV